MPKFVFKVSFPVTQYYHTYARDEAAAREKIERQLSDELDPCRIEKYRHLLKTGKSICEILGAPDDISEVKIELLPQE